MTAMLPQLDPMAAGAMGACTLAEVVSVKDPEGLNRVQVRLLAYDGVDGQDGPIWARVAVPFAGQKRGAFMLPDRGDEVLVAFVNGDQRLPVVVGSLWHGAAAAPDALGGSGDSVDRWTIVGKAGTRIAIVEEQSGEATITLKTPGKESVVITQGSGGKVELKTSSNTVTMDTQGITIDAKAKVKVKAAQVEVSTGLMKVDSGMSIFSGVVKCTSLVTESVASKSYTPGAGNVW